MANEWYYALNGERSNSPVSSSQLKQMAAAGKLQPSDLVWKEGLPDWVPASSLKGLFASTPAPRSAAPPPSSGFGAANDVQEIGADALVDEEDYDRRPRGPSAGGDLIVQLLLRLIAWDVGATAVTPGERSRLEASGVTGEAGQRYLAWRFAYLLGVILATFISAIFGTIDVIQVGFEMFNGLGAMVAVLSLLAEYALPGLALAAALLWTRPKMSRFLLYLGLGVGVLLPLLLGLLPARWQIKERPIMMGMPGGGEMQGGGMPGQSLMGLGLVLFVAFGLAWLRGGVRIKTLLPKATLPGWMMSVAAAFHSTLR